MKIKMKKIENNLIQRITIKLQKNKSCQQEVNYLRLSWDDRNINKLFQLSSIRRNEKLIHNHFFPDNYYVINSCNPLSVIDEVKEFEWANRVLNLKNKEIDEFIKIKNEYERNFLEGEFESCYKLLYFVEQELGFSIWLIKNRISLIQKTKGLSEQKQFSTGVIEQCLQQGIAGCITYYSSMLAEDAVNLDNYIESIKNLFKKNELDHGLFGYLRYQLIPFSKIARKNYAGILRFAYKSSLIDLFFAYVDIKTSSEFDKEIFKEKYNISDVSIGKKCESDMEYAGHVIKSIDFLLNSDYENALAHADKMAKIDVTNIIYIDIISRMESENALLAIPANLQSLLNKIHVIRNGKNNWSDLLIEVVKYAMINSYLSSSRYVLVMVLDGNDPVTLKDYAWLMSRVANECLWYTPLYYEYSDKFNEFFDINISQKYESISQYISILTNCASIKEIISACKNIHVVEPLVKSLIVNDNEDFVLYIKSISSSFNSISSLTLKRMLAYCHIENSNYREAIEMIVDASINNMDIIEKLPVSKCKEYIVLDKYLDLGNINTPIFYVLYEMHSNINSESEIKDALEDFLDINNITKPSNIESCSSLYDRNKLVFFLRYVCTEQLMDKLLCFSEALDVSNERMAICKYLSVLDSTNQNAYQEEITNILRKIRTREQLRRVEKSKIYVDIERLTSIAERLIGTQFDRLKGLMESVGRADVNKLIRLNGLYIALNADKKEPSILNIPKNELYTILIDIFLKLAEIFSSNTEYGLDGYLSVRIRHGTLTGQLRAPFDNEKITTQVGIGSTKYKENTYWKERLNLPDSQWQSVNNVLAKLSQKLDDHIKSIISKKIQIRRNLKDEGLFDFTPITVITKFCSSSTILRADSPHDCCKFVFDECLMPCLESSLIKIRYCFEHEFKIKALEIINDARRDLGSKNLSHDASELMQALVATHTATVYAYNRSKEWFKISNSSGIEEFLIQDVIDVCEKSMKYIDVGFCVQSNICDLLKFNRISGLFSSFVDVFINIFQNISKHSGEDVEHFADVNIDYDGYRLFINIDNKISPEISCDECIDKIKLIKSDIDSGNYLNFVKREHGSGLCKVNKIIMHDISNFGIFKFNCDRDNKIFHVEIVIPQTIVGSM